MTTVTVKDYTLIFQFFQGNEWSLSLANCCKLELNSWEIKQIAPLMLNKTN